MKVHQLKRLFAVTLYIVCGAGCAPTIQLVPRPDYSQVTASTTHVEVMRSDPLAPGLSLDVEDNGRLIGRLGTGGSLLWEREAGHMILVIRPVLIGVTNRTVISQNLVGAQHYTFDVTVPGLPTNHNPQHFTRPIALTTPEKDSPASSPQPPQGVFKATPPIKLDLSNYPDKDATMAILTFDARSGLSTDEVALLADRFAVELGRMEAYKLVSRSKMKEVLELQQFAAACTSIECAVVAGQLLGVENMVYGSIGKLGSLFTINVYLVSVEKGAIVASAMVDYQGQIEGLLTEGMQRTVHNLLLAVMEQKPKLAE